MIKQEIIEKISQFFKLTTYDAEKILDDIFLKIMNGVKDDNIVDIANFGEFIIKYNNGKNGTPAPYKKTIEFLPSTVLEEEIGHKNFDLIRKQVYRTTPQIQESVKPEEKQKEKPVEPIVKKVEEQVKKPEVVETKEILKVTEKKSEEPQIKSEPEKPYKILEPESSTGSIEEDFKKKREALLNKISIHPLQDSDRVKKPEVQEFHYNIPREDTAAESKIEEQKEIDLHNQELLKKQEEERKRSIVEEEKRKIAAEEEKRKLAEEEAKRVADEEAKRKTAAEEEAKRRIAEEETKRKIAAEDERRRLAEEEKRRIAEEEKKKEIVAKQKEESEKIIPPVIAAPVEEDISQKSFSDYFTEVKPEDKLKKPVTEEKETSPHVIPKEAVELHQQITSTAAGVGAFPSQTIQTGDQFIEHRAEDKSYYIWYKDSEPNVSETQTMSYEYELLYQATKEAEYKSKLRIYVTTFILFFSIVLVLLIFSPVIYKIFFTPPAENQENIQLNEEQKPKGPTSYDQKATLNVPPISINQNNIIADTINHTQNNTQAPVTDPPSQTTQQQQENKQPPAVNGNQSNTQQEQQKPQTQTQQPQTQQQTQNPKLDGVQKNNVGWSDEKLKVIYIQLENGKYAIQESAWDSDSKASKRISLVESLKIEGMKGTVIKADLGSKGVWYRTRFGEFSTLDEAKQKAEELRSKEKVRFQTALLMYFLLYA